MKSRLRTSLIGGGLLLALMAVGWWMFGARQQPDTAVVLPATPAFDETQHRLRDAVAAAMARADSSEDALDALKQLARLYHANGYLDEAQAGYETLEQLDPEEPRWPHLHAVILAGYGDFEPAMARWRRVIELAQGNMSQAAKLLGISRGTLYGRLESSGRSGTRINLPEGNR